MKKRNASSPTTARAVALATLLALPVIAGAIGCSSAPADGAPFDFGSPPGTAEAPPDNGASPSTSVSSYPVSGVDSDQCVNATKAIYELFGTNNFNGSTGHYYTDSIDEGLSYGYAYDGPLNFLNSNVIGSLPVTRCGTKLTTAPGPTCQGMLFSSSGPIGYVYRNDAPAPSGTAPLYGYYNSKNGDFYYSTREAAPSGYAVYSTVGYIPRLACKNLSSTCQLFPSSYTGYTANPAPDEDTGENTNYSNNAPAPPWFGNYGKASASVGHRVSAILPGDWGTSNNVDWDPGNDKAECGYSDWMTGLSSDPGHHGALHAFRCATSEFALSPRMFGGKSNGLNCVASTGDQMGNNGSRDNAKYFRYGLSQWDIGYTKHSCGSGSYLAGVSSDAGYWSVYHESLCCEQAGVGGDDCAPVIVGKTSSEQHTSTTVDALGNPVPLDWDPPANTGAASYPKAECGAGRRMMGSSYDDSGALHAILCCTTPAPPASEASQTCCSPQTLQKAVANCNADHVTYGSDCDNIVAPCCSSDPNSDGVGGSVCTAIAEALDPDATAGDGPDANTGGETASKGSACGGDTGSAIAWSYAFDKSGGAGSKTFGASYSGDVSFGAGPIYATGDARVSAKASLFGATISIAFVDLSANLTDTPLHAQINVLGKDLYVYPKSKKQDNSAGAPPPTTPTKTGTDWTWDTRPAGSPKGKADSNTLTYTETFFTETEVIVIFGVPLTITGTIAGQVGLIGSVNTAGNTLDLSATPWVGATATCTAALGGGKGAFRLEAGVEGSLNLFTASLPTTALVSPYTNQVNYTVNSDFTLSALSGSIKAFLKVRLKPFFRKTFKTTLAHWEGPTLTAHLFHYNGCMKY